jgi:hypothetical protein
LRESNLTASLGVPLPHWIETAMRYIHPDESDVFGIVAAMNRSATLPRPPAKPESSRPGANTAIED